MGDTPVWGLIVVGHGSHVNAESAEPVFEHVRRIQGWEVWPAFWKEEPSLPDALAGVEAPCVVVVPLFISQGYFVDRVVPRELGLPSGETHVLHEVRGHQVVYAEPVGTHPAMTGVVEALVQQAREGERGAYTLVLVGHGTERHRRSSEAIWAQVRALEREGREVRAAFLDEAPYVEDVLGVCAHRDVVVVPYFISEGLHSRHDIPEALGWDGREEGPQEIQGHRVWYTTAVGRGEEITQVVLARAKEARAAVGDVHAPSALTAVVKARQALAASLVSGDVWGQVRVSCREDGSWVLTHVEDVVGDPDVRVVQDLWAWARRDAVGAHRPLASAPTLAPGGCMVLGSAYEAACALDGLYPGVAMARAGGQDVCSWEEIAARQTGIYRGVDALSEEALLRVRAETCEGCLRGALWAGEEGGALPCVRPCGHYVAAGRALTES